MTLEQRYEFRRMSSKRYLKQGIIVDDRAIACVFGSKQSECSCLALLPALKVVILEAERMMSDDA